MKDISHFAKIFLSVKPIDFRKQTYGLASLVKVLFAEQPTDSRSLFVFTNKSKTSVRMLYWDQTGFALWTKVLEKDRFKWPKRDDTGKINLNQRELKWLLQGIDLDKIKFHRPIDFARIV